MRREQEYISVSLNEDSIKVVHLMVSDSVKKLINVAKRDLKGISEEELPKVIQSFLTTINLRKAKVIVVVPSNMVTTKNIEVPSRDPAEIKSIINLQAGRHTPYSREEVLVSYITIGIYQSNYTKVLLVIINRNVIKKQLGVLEKAGLKIERVLFAAEGVVKFYARTMDLGSEDVPVGIIEVGSQWTDFSIELHGAIIACRSISIGLKNLSSEGPSGYEKLIGELVKSIESYQSEDIDKVPVTFILTSDDVRIKDLQPLLKERLKTNIKIVPYLDHLEAAQTAFLKIIQDYNDDSFLDVIGAGEFMDHVQIDLMPEEMKLQKSIQEQSREIIQAGVQLIVMLILVCGIFIGQLNMKTLHRNNVTVDYNDVRKEVETLEGYSTKTRLVKDYLNSRMVSLEVINELYRLIPQEIYLENIDMDDKGSIDIRGTSDSMSLVFSLVTALEESTLFKSVKTKSTNAKKERGKDMAAFEIVFKLESAKDEVEESDDNKSDKEKKPKEETPEKG